MDDTSQRPMHKANTVALVFLSYPLAIASMTWANTWKDIIRGGPTRWKIDDIGLKQKALAFIAQHTSEAKQSPMHILCPLAGDDPFVHQAWLKGHSVTSIDLVPDAVEMMRRQFSCDDTDWEKEERGSSTVWKHKSGRATLYVGDMLAKRPELINRCDAVYDKDSFGALDKEMRAKFCERLAEFTKDNAIVYVEVKFKDSRNPGRWAGPPFHVERDDLMESTNFGSAFSYVSALGKVYDLGMAGMSQTAHILKRSPLN